MNHSLRQSPPNRFVPIALEADGDFLDSLEPDERIDSKVKVFVDTSRSVISENDSPDVPFDASVNPYRGCEHACSYCYARNAHEYLGFNAGEDFERIIFAKPNAAALLQDELASPMWKPRWLCMSGITDCYQPVERKLKITRACVQVLSEARHPLGVITKNHLVTRDIDLFEPMAKVGAIRVDISLTTLDVELSRKMEPRASSPQRRLHAVWQLAARGIPVGILVCPVIPGLNDHELPSILKAAKAAGALWAHFTPVRLPGNVEQVFVDWLRRAFPDRAEKVLRMIRDLRGGEQLNDARFGHRMRGQSLLYEQTRQLFLLHRDRLGLQRSGPAFDSSAFVRPRKGRDTQLRLFEP